jgi:hypothetical protein
MAPSAIPGHRRGTNAGSAGLACGFRSRPGEILARAGLKQLTAREGDGHELGTCVDPQLSHGMLYVRANCLRRDEEILGDAIRLLPQRDQSDDLTLTSVRGAA